MEQLTPPTDLQHLKLLRLFHYIWGTFCCLFGLIGVIYAWIGEEMLRSFQRLPPGQENTALIFGGLFVAFSLFDVVLLETCGMVSLLVAGKYGARRSYFACFAASVFNCVMIPVGTVLGVFSLIVLTRPSVKALFKEAKTAP
jgi:hypothetical protein